jgi:PAS domain S-box-containing protein
MSHLPVHILLIEDEEAHAELIRRAFERHPEKFEISLANCLADAHRQIELNPQDLIIADYRLPDGKGTEIIKHLDGEVHLPVIMMTSHGDEKVAVDAMKAGALDYIVKSEDAFVQIPAIAERTLRAWGHIERRKAAEKALKDSQARLRSVVGSAPVMLCAINPDGVFTLAEGRILKRLGLDSGLLVGQSAFSVFSDYPVIVEDVRGALAGRSITATRLFRDYHLQTQYTPVSDQSGNLMEVVAVSTDVTERKHARLKQQRLQVQLHKAQRLEALGTLAGGIAHDFNNLLMGIQGRASLMRFDIDSTHAHYEHVIGIEEYVKSATELTRQLLGLARVGKYDVRPIDMNRLVLKITRMFSRTRKELRIQTDLESCLKAVDADRGQIEQVLLNLLVNAWQAMPTGGNIRIETRNETLDEPFLKPHELEPGDYVRISVGDSGIGMDDRTQEKIFDPFFTTKEKSRGTGLGLASAYGIVKNHNGLITVQSEKGRGATFDIYLPASKAERVADPITCKASLTGNETVLIVDDERYILDVGRQLLQKLGYRVLVAGNGRDALKIYDQQKGRIDLVILDMIMPDMSGSQTFDALKQIDPRVRALLSSGYSIDGEATQILNRGCNGFIQKPFSLEALSRKIRQVLQNDRD